MSAVDVRNVSKRYGAVTALDRVSLAFPNGSFFALLGPSGSGKTTLLRALAGFVEPDDGMILIDDRDVAHIPSFRRNIGMVFQNYALFPHMSVFDNVAFGLTVRRLPRAEVRQRVGRILELVRLDGLDDRKPRELSGGQQQRVALARALVTEPRVLLLDEPLGALDKKLRQDMQGELKRIQRTVGITTIFVTHDQEEALTLSDHIAIIDEGRLIQVGEPGDVYDRPHTRFAANFLGDANFLSGPVQDSGIMVDHVGHIATTSPLPAGEATIAVRPERIRLAAPDAPTQDNRIEGQVAERVFSGASLTYTVDTDAGPLRVLRQNTDGDVIGIGERVALVWSADHSVVVED